MAARSPSRSPSGRVRLDSPARQMVAAAMVIAHTLGGGAAHTFDALASSLRARASAQREAEVMAAQARASALVIGVAPFAFAMVIAAVDPSMAAARRAVGCRSAVPRRWHRVRDRRALLDSTTVEEGTMIALFAAISACHRRRAAASPPPGPCGHGRPVCGGRCRRPVRLGLRGGPHCCGCAAAGGGAHERPARACARRCRWPRSTTARG